MFYYRKDFKKRCNFYCASFSITVSDQNRPKRRLSMVTQIKNEDTHLNAIFHTIFSKMFHMCSKIIQANLYLPRILKEMD